MSTFMLQLQTIRCIRPGKPAMMVEITNQSRIKCGYCSKGVIYYSERSMRMPQMNRCRVCKARTEYDMIVRICK